MVAYEAAVAGCENDVGDAFVDIEVVEERRVLVKEGIGGVCGEVECTAALVSADVGKRLRAPTLCS